MFKLIVIRIAVLISSSLIFSCGGGGDSAPQTSSVHSSPPAAATSNNSSVVATVDTKSDKTMQELVAADDFSFTNKQAIQVSISLPEYQEERAYISVYSDYQQLKSKRYYPNASSRTLAGGLQQGQFNHSFVTLNKQSSYLVEVWFYDGRDALQKEIVLSNNELSW